MLLECPIEVARCPRMTRPRKPSSAPVRLQHPARWQRYGPWRPLGATALGKFELLGISSAPGSLRVAGLVTGATRPRAGASRFETSNLPKRRGAAEGSHGPRCVPSVLDAGAETGADDGLRRTCHTGQRATSIRAFKSIVGASKKRPGTTVTHDQGRSPHAGLRLNAPQPLDATHRRTIWDRMVYSVYPQCD